MLFSRNIHYTAYIEKITQHRRKDCGIGAVRCRIAPHAGSGSGAPHRLSASATQAHQALSHRRETSQGGAKDSAHPRTASPLPLLRNEARGTPAMPRKAAASRLHPWYRAPSSVDAQAPSTLRFRRRAAASRWSKRARNASRMQSRPSVWNRARPPPFKPSSSMAIEEDGLKHSPTTTWTACPQPRRRGRGGKALSGRIRRRRSPGGASHVHELQATNGPAGYAF